MGFGDRDTRDIGFASLSGAAERNEDIMYIYYGNEAFMNTRIQRSSLAPYTHGPLTSVGKREFKKPLLFITLQHKYLM